MIGFLHGMVAERSGDRALIDVGGIGYQVHVSASTLGRLPPAGRKARLLTHLQVRDDQMILYGFATGAERDLFLLLLGVTGIGPKVALQILSVLAPEALRRAILAGDAEAIMVVPGVGKKVAARIVLDLKEKLGGEVEVPVEGPLVEVREALAGMGLGPDEVRTALEGLEPDGQPVEELLRAALRRVGTG
jgi:Holliday junction DNA helicase RuvA